MSRKKTDVSEEPIINEEGPLYEPSVEPKKKTEIYEVCKGDTIQSIAVRFGIDWKTLAMSNNIKEPYAIHKGQKLKLSLLTDL